MLFQLHFKLFGSSCNTFKPKCRLGNSYVLATMGNDLYDSEKYAAFGKSKKDGKDQESI